MPPSGLKLLGGQLAHQQPAATSPPFSPEDHLETIRNKRTVGLGGDFLSKLIPSSKCQLMDTTILNYFVKLYVQS